MQVLIISSGLPESNKLLTMAPLARQIASLRTAGVQVTNLEVSGLPKVKYLQTLPRLWRASREVDLIHAHFGYSGWIALTCRAKPIVVSFMGDDLLGTPDSEGRLTLASRLAAAVNRWVARRVDAVIVKSEEMAREVGDVDAYVIPNGVDLEAFTPMSRHEARRRLGWSVDRTYVLFPGNPDTPRKGHPLARSAVATAARLLEQEVDLVALWNVAPEQVPLYMNACDAMLMTSFVEGSPNVVKEAMACNLPVVSVPVGDVPQLIGGVSGYAVLPRDAGEIGASLASLLRERPRVDGRQTVLANGLGLDSVARRICDVYEAVLRYRDIPPETTRRGRS
jgi:glycosyltransferase involved in cell wall biosynthesis